MPAKPKPPRPSASHTARFPPQAMEWLFAGLLGALLGYSLVAFGNPVILDDPAVPHTGVQWVGDASAPTNLRYGLLAGVAVIGALAARWTLPTPRWLLALPIAWLLWQFIASTQTVDPNLSTATLKQFASCVACFYLGVFALGRVRSLAPFWLLLVLGFLYVLWVGFEQHFGGLEATRRYFEIYELPKMERIPENLMARLESERIFSTLVYPNALAGVILLLGPALCVALWQMTAPATFLTRGLLVSLIAGAALACLYWSGSKAGWLLALVMGMTVLLHLPFACWKKIALVSGVLILGLIGFFVQFADYFEEGATSVAARFDYWQAAWTTALEHPGLGTGPGTFSVPYARLKDPESEMARLTHNDYLEQASDSGFVGLILYTVFVWGSVGLLYFRRRRDPLAFAIWLGVLAWSLQGFVEFGLYIPALAWPAFLFFGVLWGWECRVNSNRHPQAPPATVGSR